jgi:hypothetical protein
MTVYFDGIHLFSEDLEELHELAHRTGLKREWFQNNKKLPHYDIWGSRIQAAIKAGAVKCKGEKTLELMNIYRKKTGESNERKINS